jgi:hypothetical protein
MSRGNPSGLEASIKRSRRPERIGRDASAPLVPRISRGILRNLGMSDDEIAQYFCRFRHGRSEQFVQTVLHKHYGMCRGWRGHTSNEGAVSWPKTNITAS